MIFNIHNPSTGTAFSFPYRDSDTLPSVLSRVADKAGIPSGEKVGTKGGWMLRYEFKGAKYSLDDEDDFAILLSRYPPSSTTEEPNLFLTGPVGSNHPPFQSGSAQSSTDGKKATSHKKSVSTASVTQANTIANGRTGSPAPQQNEQLAQRTQQHQQRTRSTSAASQNQGQHQTHYSQGQHPTTNPLLAHLPTYTSKPSPIPTPLAPPPPPQMQQSPGRPSSVKSGKSSKSVTPSHMANHPPHHHLGQVSHPTLTNTQLEPERRAAAKALAQQQKEAGMNLTHKKEWEEFHETRGVRTIMGQIGPVQNVRMLMKAGYKHVYLSRKFAVANGFIPKDAAPGYYGYTGLVNLGSWAIKVGSKTQSHAVMLSEEIHFDVILGSSWMEKMRVKTDPLDQTSVTLMGGAGKEDETIPCDVVLIKDGKGEHVLLS